MSENLLEQDFYASSPNQKWTGDITYLRTDEGWLYLAVVIDLWSRAVIGWSMAPRIQSASQKWTMPLKDWCMAMSRLIIDFGDRLDVHI
ncbi:hypothetical protein JNE17039_44620 (plasmid) [Escherichia coli]